VEAGPGADIKAGNNLPPAQHPGRHHIHAIELRPAEAPRSPARPGAACSWSAKRAAGASCGCRPGEMRYVDVRCRATVGEVGNAEQSNINWGKAGRMRWKGKRPTVRGCRR
jgi:large subunit ribosomal protein L2